MYLCIYIYRNDLKPLFQSTSKGKILMNIVDLSLSGRCKTVISAIHSHLLATDLQTSGTECRYLHIVILIMFVYGSRLFIRYIYIYIYIYICIYIYVYIYIYIYIYIWWSFLCPMLMNCPLSLTYFLLALQLLLQSVATVNRTEACGSYRKLSTYKCDTYFIPAPAALTIISKPTSHELLSVWWRRNSIVYISQLCCSSFQASAAVYIRSSLFWGVSVAYVGNQLPTSSAWNSRSTAIPNCPVAQKVTCIFVHSLWLLNFTTGASSSRL